jgi:hypothetical protein
MSNERSAVLTQIHFSNDAVSELASDQPPTCLGALSTR